MGAQQVKLARDGIGSATTFGGTASRRRVKMCKHVGIAEATQAVVAAQDGEEKLLLGWAQNVERPGATSFEADRFVDLINSGRRRAGHDGLGQSIEITLVAGAGDGMRMRQIADTLVHGAP